MFLHLVHGRITHEEAPDRSPRTVPSVSPLSAAGGNEVTFPGPCCGQFLHFGVRGSVASQSSTASPAGPTGPNRPANFTADSCAVTLHLRTTALPFPPTQHHFYTAPDHSRTLRSPTHCVQYCRQQIQAVPGTVSSAAHDIGPTTLGPLSGCASAAMRLSDTRDALLLSTASLCIAARKSGSRSLGKLAQVLPCPPVQFRVAGTSRCPAAPDALGKRAFFTNGARVPPTVVPATSSSRLLMAAPCHQEGALAAKFALPTATAVHLVWACQRFAGRSG